MRIRFLERLHMHHGCLRFALDQVEVTLADGTGDCI